MKILEQDGSVTYTKRGGFATEAEAEKSYKKYEAEFKKACRAQQIFQGTGADMGLKDYLLYWFEEEYSQRIENTTRMVGAYTLYNLLYPHMDQDVKLRRLNAGYLDSLLETAAKACPSAGNKCRELLNTALKDAVIHGYIRSNPVSGTRTYPRPNPKVRILSKAKLKILMDAAYNSPWYFEVLLAITAGLRKGEILGLQMADFDIARHTVSISRQITSNPIIPKGTFKIEAYDVIAKLPKTAESIRTLKVPDAVMKELEKRKKIVDGNKAKLGDAYIDHGYVSCQPNGLPHSVTAFNSALTAMCSRNSLPHVTPHGLRHQYAAILMENGVSIAKISALLGHSSVTTTYEYYCSVMDENDRIIDFLNAAFVPEGRSETDAG